MFHKKTDVHCKISTKYFGIKGVNQIAITPLSEKNVKIAMLEDPFTCNSVAIIIQK